MLPGLSDEATPESPVTKAMRPNASSGEYRLHAGIGPAQLGDAAGCRQRHPHIAQSLAAKCEIGGHGILELDEFSGTRRVDDADAAGQQGAYAHLAVGLNLEAVGDGAF